MNDYTISNEQNFHSLKKQTNPALIVHAVFVSEEQGQGCVDSDFIVDWQTPIPHMEIRNS